MSPSWIRVGPKPNSQCPFKRRAGDTEERDTQRLRLERSCHKSGTTPEAGTQPPLDASDMRRPGPHLDFNVPPSRPVRIS